MNRIVLVLIAAAFLASPAGAAGELPQSPVLKDQKKISYPKIVLYSVSWCPHCKAAKEYLTSRDIPFINKDVELDEKAMEELTEVYKSQGVPVIVIGDNAKVVRGFTPEMFEKAVKEVQKSK